MEMYIAPIVYCGNILGGRGFVEEGMDWSIGRDVDMDVERRVVDGLRVIFEGWGSFGFL